MKKLLLAAISLGAMQLFAAEDLPKIERKYEKLSTQLRMRAQVDVNDSTHAFEFEADDDSIMTGTEHYGYDESANIISYMSYDIDSNDTRVPDESATLTRDADGNITEEVYSEYNDSLEMLVLDEKYVYTYNADGQYLTYDEYYYDLDAKEWVHSGRGVWTYNASGSTTSYKVEYYDEDSDSWVGTYYYTQTYDSNNNRIKYMRYQWDGDNNDWKDYLRYDYTYNSDNNETSFISWVLQNSVLTKYTRITSDYSDTLLSVKVRYNYDADNDAWEESTKDTFTYNSDNLVGGTLTSYYSNGEWVNSSRRLYTYSDGNKTSEFYGSNFNSFDDSWDTTEYYKLTVDAEGRTIHSESKSGSDGQWYYGYKTTNAYSGDWITSQKSYDLEDGQSWRQTYESYRSIKNNQETYYRSRSFDWVTEQMYTERSYVYFNSTIEVQNSISEFQENYGIYPNPVQDVLFMDLMAEGEKTVEFYNLNGQLILTERVSGVHERFDVSTLLNGMYLIKVSTEDGEEARSTFVKH